MKISETHQCFANWLNDQRALSNPDEFLGPNWKEVLNFWFFLDTLSPEQFSVARRRYWALDSENMDSTENLAWRAASNVTSKLISNDVWWDSHNYNYASRSATIELIGAHKILEEGKILTFVPMFLNL